MAKMGRPLIGERPRSIPVSCRLTEEEYHRLQALAFRRGCSKTDLLRLAIIDLLRGAAVAVDKPAGSS